MNRYAIILDYRLVSVNLSKDKALAMARSVAKRIHPYQVVSVEKLVDMGNPEIIFLTNGEKQ